MLSRIINLLKEGVKIYNELSQAAVIKESNLPLSVSNIENYVSLDFMQKRHERKATSTAWSIDWLNGRKKFTINHG